MTEDEWLACTNPLRLLDYVGAALESRKALLVTVACFRRHWERLPAVAQEWVRLAEVAAEGRAARHDLDDNFEALEESLNVFGPPGEFVALLDMAYGMWKSEWPYLDEGERDPAWLAERKAHAALVRDIFGNPFRPVTPDPIGQTGQVVALAQATYEDRTLPAGTFDPTRLAVLADAVEEAGCTNPDLLGHLRGPGPHVRGCWAVDLLLGKE
jgi:hypothetical protein